MIVILDFRFYSLNIPQKGLTKRIQHYPLANSYNKQSYKQYGDINEIWQYSG